MRSYHGNWKQSRTPAQILGPKKESTTKKIPQRTKRQLKRAAASLTKQVNPALEPTEQRVAVAVVKRDEHTVSKSDGMTILKYQM